MSVKHAVAGSLAGAVLLAGGIIGWQILKGGDRAAAERPQSTSLTESTAPERSTYTSARAISEALAKTSVGCGNFTPAGRLVNGEVEAAECGINQRKARISMYGSQSEVSKVLDASTGRDAYGMPVNVVSGENWIITFPRGSNPTTSAAVAEEIADTLDGTVVKP
ncbi:hypothetical protein [Nonomuraea typhae]|uniref:DUF3515 domain-containing protein n=1 Tax=Nonomuraea typhae TaxID=2603600 RepID=A0ABW7YNC9_9ACTN